MFFFLFPDVQVFLWRNSWKVFLKKLRRSVAIIKTENKERVLSSEARILAFIVSCHVKWTTVISSLLSRSGTFHTAAISMLEYKFPKLASCVIYLQLYHEQFKIEYSAIALLSYTVLPTTQTIAVRPIAGRTCNFLLIKVSSHVQYLFQPPH
jgi:hypothetical protein